MFLTVGASSCGSVQRRLVCKQLIEAELKPLPLCDISFKFNRCRCRCFDFNQWATLPLNKCKELNKPEHFSKSILVVEELLNDGRPEVQTVEAINFPIEHCEGISGFSIQDMALEVAPKVKLLNNIKERFCD